MLRLLALALSAAPPPAPPSDPTDRHATAGSRYQVARVAYERGDHAEAERIFREVTSLSPEFPEPLIALSQIMGQSNRRQEQEYFLREAVNRLPPAAAEDPPAAAEDALAIADVKRLAAGARQCLSLLLVAEDEPKIAVPPPLSPAK